MQTVRGTAAVLDVMARSPTTLVPQWFLLLLTGALHEERQSCASAGGTTPTTQMTTTGVAPSGTTQRGRDG